MPDSPDGQERMPQTEKRHDPAADTTDDTYAADEEQLVAQRLRELGYIE
jgi:hypothetical protein